MESSIEKDLEIISNFININSDGIGIFTKSAIMGSFERISDFCRETIKRKFVDTSAEIIGNSKHYHYFVSYTLKENDGSFGFGEMEITTKIKINHTDIKLLRKIILDHAKKESEKVENTVMLAVLPL